MNLRAVGHSVIVKPAPLPEWTHGGIALPVAYQTPSSQGTVLSVGGRVKDDALKPGAEVYYSWIDAKEVEHAGEKVVVIHYGSLKGIKDL